MSIWDSIRTPVAGQFSLRVIKTCSFGNWSWIKESDQKVGIALELKSEFSLTDCSTSKYFSIKSREAQSLGHIITVVCQDEEFYEIFEVLCLDLVSETSNAVDERDAISALKARINLWSYLFKSLKKMGRKEVYGLAAELSFLLEWISLNFSVNEWVGPKGKPQDFINEPLKKAVEVKACSSDLSSVKISSLEQLDFDGDLLLCVYPINACTAGNHSAKTLPSLVSYIRNLLKDDDLIVFNRRLALSGYSDDAGLETFIFEISTPSFYSVSPGFPRIVRTNIATEITNCHYDLDLLKCKNFLKNNDFVIKEFLN